MSRRPSGLEAGSLEGISTHDAQSTTAMAPLSSFLLLSPDSGEPAALQIHFNPRIVSPARTAGADPAVFARRRIGSRSKADFHADTSFELNLPSYSPLRMEYLIDGIHNMWPRKGRGGRPNSSWSLGCAYRTWSSRTLNAATGSHLAAQVKRGTHRFGSIINSK